MREYKKVYIFCLSGNINGLRTLFKYNQFATDKTLKKQLLEMLLTWVTFADQLSNAFECDHSFLNEIFAFLIENIKKDPKSLQG
jgi:hypothetical protein